MPPSTPQSALRAPLNTILGTEANVRLLRVLVLAETSLAAGELARRAVLGRTTVYPVLESLEATGIVEFIGAGAQRQVRFRKDHPLATPIATLFRVESERVDAMATMLRRVIATITPSPSSAWLEGEILAGTDQEGDTITCMLLGDPVTLPPMIDALSRNLERVERKFDVHIEVKGITRSELASRALTQQKRLTDVILVSGVPPTAFLPHAKRSRSGIMSHGDHDATARRLAIAIAEKARQDPGLIPIALRHIRQREKSASMQEGRELREWARVLAAMTPSRLRRFLVDPSERATRLRQTLPALNLLTPAERKAVLASTSDAEARAIILRKRRVGRREIGS